MVIIYETEHLEGARANNVRLVSRLRLKPCGLRRVK
jgi:hypothetical protein